MCFFFSTALWEQRKRYNKNSKIVRNCLHGNLSSEEKEPINWNTWREIPNQLAWREEKINMIEEKESTQAISEPRRSNWIDECEDTWLVKAINISVSHPTCEYIV